MHVFVPPELYGLLFPRYVFSPGIVCEKKFRGQACSIYPYLGYCFAWLEIPKMSQSRVQLNRRNLTCGRQSETLLLFYRPGISALKTETSVSR